MQMRNYALFTAHCIAKKTHKKQTLIYSKRSNFITRLAADKKQGLIVHLTHLAESWGGKDNGFGLAECCQDTPVTVGRL